ncbi:putative 2-aminoethylphosphonate ABC transporter ATP-binding protein [Paenibacillus sp. RC67]|uniref:putative 2-aminoethylphosphonate ABC transporter ATP-binding protein n=1 Tax=Paenibacillus sp. RC67 TaxID=3039392 RepID=UPI0024AD088D|nr:putative 2-aminoethylphosphonate ABC transporter ATP-binding protein [Paenibacillus sp. RC67]
MTDYLKINNVNKSFGKFDALKQIQIGIQKGEFVCLLGPSGCGKTTLLRILAGLESSDSGSVVMNGKDITYVSPAKRNFGIVFQSYALFPNLTAYENITYGLKGKGMAKQDIHRKVEEMLEMVGLSQARDRYPSQLSGGQQQRIALARAIALSPDVLLLDEPLSALDAKVRHKLRQEICDLQKRLGITTVMVTHDQEEALTMADRIIVMNHAEVIQIGTPEDIYDRPRTPFVADFIGTMNFIHQQADPRSERKDECLLSVRPEHIRIVSKPMEGGIHVALKFIEFRGSFYRITVQTVLKSHRIDAGQTLKIDVPVEEFRHLRMDKGDKFTIVIPEESLISFKDPVELDMELLETAVSK